MSQNKVADEFASFLSGVASRLRHDLKGGLITLRMGLEALPDEEELKPLLLERAQHLEGLADKLVLLLRMGQMRRQPTRLSALLGEFRSQANDRFPLLEIELPSNFSSERPEVDGDALIFSLLEVAENAQLAGASHLKLTAENRSDELLLELRDNGEGIAASDTTDGLAALGFSRWERAGLGLSIVRRCAQGHGGDFSIRGNSDRGATVTMDLGQTAV